MDTQTKARVALGLALAGAAAWISLNFLPAVLWACVVAVAVDPLRRRALARLPGRDETVAIAITALVALLVVIPLLIGTAQGIAEGHDLYAWYARAQTQGIPVPQWIHNLPWGAGKVSSWWDDHLARPENAREQLQRIKVETLLAHGKLLGHSVAERLILFFFSMTTLFFVLKERDAIVGQLRNAAVRAFGPAGERVGRQILASVRGTIDGLVIVGLVEGVIMTITYAISGTPHPVLLGILTGVGGMVPFGLLAFVLVAVALLVVKGAMVAAICVGAFAFALNFCADHFVRPALIGGATKLPFVWVLIGILGGVESIGLLGLFVGPAIMASFILVWREFSGAGAEEDAAPAPRSPAEISRNATLEDVVRAMESPSDIRVAIQVKGQDGPAEMAVLRVSTTPGDRSIEVGRWPTGADSIRVPEDKIEHLAVVFD